MSLPRTYAGGGWFPAQILQRAGWQYNLRHPWQLALSILGIAVGVAVVVAIDIANISAGKAFDLSSRMVLGNTTHSIQGEADGLPEYLYRELRVDLGMRRSAPMVEGYGAVRKLPGRSFRILGLDPFAERGYRSYLLGFSGTSGQALGDFLTKRGTMLLSKETARELGLTPGEGLELRINGRLHTLTLGGVLSSTDGAASGAMENLLVTDISTAQELLGMVGRLSRIDLIVPDGDPGDRWLDQIRQILPPGVRLVGAALQTSMMRQISSAFSLNLSMLSLLALVVGAFLIYNTMTFAVVRRRTMLGTLRTLGVTREELFHLILWEALLVGAAGTLFGIMLGIVMADGFLGLITRTINDLYYVLTVREVTISSPALFKAAVLGLGTAVAAACIPAWEAASVSPRIAMQRSRIESRARYLVPRAATAGVLVLGAGGLVLLIPGDSLFLGFAGLFGVILGFTLLAPGVMVITVRLLNPLIRVAGSYLGAMSARGLTSSLSRTAVAVAALMVAVSATVGVGIMVDSFRQTVDRWLKYRLQADIYVTAPGVATNRSRGILDPGLVERLATTPGVAHMSSGRHLTLHSSLGQIQTTVLRIAPDSVNGFRFLSRLEGDLWSSFQELDTVLISEPFAFRHNLEPGARIPFITPRGKISFKVVGIYADFASDRGIVVMSRNAYRRHWDDDSISALGVYALEDVDQEALIAEMRDRVDTGQEVLIRSNRNLRETSLEVFDRTFTITIVLRMLASVVAFVGVLSALMALQLERAKEIAVLRATGFTQGQVWRMVTTQTGLMGLLSGLLAIPLGLVMAMVLILVINRRSFGWTLDIHVDPGILIQAPLLALVAAGLAGLYPAWRMARTSPALALHEE